MLDPQYSTRMLPLESESHHLLKNASKKKIKISHNLHDTPHTDSLHMMSGIKSSLKTHILFEHQRNLEAIQDLPLNFFQQKYGHWGSEANIEDEMKKVETYRKDEIDSLRIYRDELMFMALSSGNSLKLSMLSLKAKAAFQSKIQNQEHQLNKIQKQLLNESQMIALYANFLAKNYGEDNNFLSADLIDIAKQEELIMKNLEMETAHLIRELSFQNQRNEKEIRDIQEQILNLRIYIKQKQDRLRDLKAKMCTMYIKLHSKNGSRVGYKSREKNMSLSIKKFNSKNHKTIKQAFIGNNSFKNFSKELVEKVQSEEEAIKVRFYYYDADAGSKFKGQKPNKKKEKFTFQCIYKDREGLVHSENAKDTGENYQQLTRDKISEDSCVYHEIQVKYLLSIKFFYKSKIVGVECRVKTDRGNKHIQIGCCDSNVQHELLTLINKDIVTLGSFWHGKQMIGVSVWFKNRQRLLVDQHSSSSKSLKKKGIRYRENSAENPSKRNIKTKNQKVYAEYYA